MLRLLTFLVALGLGAWGLSWLSDIPDKFLITWRGLEYTLSPMVVLAILLLAAIVFGFVWSVLRFVLRLPSLVSLATRARRREKGFQALSRGMIAVGSGDSRAASRHAAEADKFLGDEAMTKLLRAQSAQLAGDRAGAVTAFNEMLDDPRTQSLGLRGLHIEARRAGESEAALEYAARAHKTGSLPWAAQAVLDDNAAHGDWAAALATVESNAAAKLLDKPTANRWRAVLKTALAQERAERDAKGALTLAQEAVALAPGLAPAAAICGKLTAQTGDYRKAAKIIETAYRLTPHPDLADAYVQLRPGDSVSDRLTRARALARVASWDSESPMMIARAAVEAHELEAARKALAPLVRGDGDYGRPTVRVCLLMAEIEEAVGDEGAVREWLNRAARAPRDRAWVGEGVITDHWSPVTPSGVLDGFVWRTPDERLATAAELPSPKLAEAAVTSTIVEQQALGTSAIEAKPADIAEPVRMAPMRPTGQTTLPLAVAPDDPGPHGNPADAQGYRHYVGD